jgi:hypothetical protein
MTFRAWFAGFVSLLVVAASARGPAVAETVRVQTREELQQAVDAAKPGTKIALAPGNYAGGLSFAGLRGEKERPIVVGAEDPTKPPVIEGGNSCLHLSDPAYVELHDLVFTKGRGNGLNIDDGGSFDTPAEHVVLRGLTVRDIGSDRNHDAIKLSWLVDFRIENCTVERWGKSGSGIDMVGCSRGVVSGCTFREGDKINANGVQIKGGSSDVTIRDCRFENAGGRAINLGGSTGLPYFRPKPQGYEAKDLVVEDCTFVGSMAPIAFVGVDGAVVRHNTFYRPTRWLLRILQENQDPQFAPCRNGQFSNNIVAFRSDESATLVNVGGKTAPETFRFADNLWYCTDVPERTKQMIRLPTPETGGTYGEDPKFKNPAGLDFGSAAGEFGPRTRPK